MKNAVFSPDEAAMFLNVAKTSILDWTNSDRLHCTVKETNHGKVRSISAKDICEFLYVNPRYQKRFREEEQPEELEKLKDLILERIDSWPRLYSLSDIAKLCDVNIGTVRAWRRDGWIKSHPNRPTYGQDLFTKEAIEAFLENHPRYKEAIQRRRSLKRKGEKR